MSRADSRVAIVTGGASGIGLATARDLAAQGWRLILVGRRAEALQAAAAELNAVALAGDVADPETHARAAALARDRFGRLDGYVACAGTTGRHDLLSTPLDEWNAVVAVNLTGCWLGVREALPLMIAGGGGAIVLISSVSAMIGGDNAAYSVAKAGLIQLARSIAVDHGPRGIRANSVCPGWVRTPLADIGRGAWAEAQGVTLDAAYAATCADAPTPRAADASEIASVVTFLLSSGASYINGTNLVVDGGGLAVDLTAVTLGHLERGA